MWLFNALKRSAKKLQNANTKMTAPQPLSPIFKLDTDCCDEIFDYLSVKDLHSFGQTCKAMQRVAGEYFKRNHWAVAKFSGNDGIYTIYSDNNGTTNERTQTSGFNKYITYISHYYFAVRPLQYIQNHAHEFDSINHLYLVCMGITKSEVKYLRAILPKIETLQIRNCSRQGDIHRDLLTYCTSLKRLLVQDADLFIFQQQRRSNPWLLQSYPHLKYLEFIPKVHMRIHELNAFFERNATVRGFSTSTNCLWTNRNELLKSTVKLDILEVKFFPQHLQYHNYYFDHPDNEDEDQSIEFQTICKLLNQLHGNGFYQRLYVYVDSIDEEMSRHLASVKCVEKLYIKNFTHIYNLSHLSSIKELSIQNGANPIDMRMFANHFVHIQRLYVSNGSVDDILPFVQQSPNLTKIYFDGNAMKLSMLNRERAKLAGARKVVIYIPERMFLDTKWTIGNGDINLEFVEMRRANSIEWDHHY